MYIDICRLEINKILILTTVDYKNKYLLCLLLEKK